MIRNRINYCLISLWKVFEFIFRWNPTDSFKPRSQNVFFGLVCYADPNMHPKDKLEFEVNIYKCNVVCKKTPLEVGGLGQNLNSNVGAATSRMGKDCMELWDERFQIDCGRIRKKSKTLVRWLYFQKYTQKYYKFRWWYWYKCCYHWRNAWIYDRFQRSSQRLYSQNVRLRFQ